MIFWDEKSHGLRLDTGQVLDVLKVLVGCGPVVPANSVSKESDLPAGTVQKLLEEMEKGI